MLKLNAVVKIILKHLSFLSLLLYFQKLNIKELN